MWFGRIITVLGGALGLVFAFNVEKLGGIIQANYEIMSFFEPPIFVIVAGALFWRRSNAIGALVSIVSGVTFGTVASFLGMSAPDRTIWAFPVCIVGLVLGSVLKELIAPTTDSAQGRIDGMLSRMRGQRKTELSTSSKIGMLLALASLIAFVTCAFGEELLPKPGNILIFLGLMMSFVYGCYLAIPAFLARDEEAPTEAGTGSIGQSWVHKCYGSGWSWLALYVIAILLVVILYYI